MDVSSRQRLASPSGCTGLIGPPWTEWRLLSAFLRLSASSTIQWECGLCCSDRCDRLWLELKSPPRVLGFGTELEWYTSFVISGSASVSGFFCSGVAFRFMANMSSLDHRCLSLFGSGAQSSPSRLGPWLFSCGALYWVTLSLGLS